MKKILITGGLGYLGGRIALSLTENADHFLRLGDINLSYDPPWLKNGELFKFDLLNDADCASACKNIDWVVHLAALNEIDSAKYPEKALLVNGDGTLKLLKAAEDAGVKRFLYFSTAHLYGAPLQGSITELTLPKPSHPYSITHRVAEDFVLSSNKLEGVVVRLSNGIGFPASKEVNRWTLIGNDLCRQAVMDKKLELKSFGLQKRDFICLSDVGRAVKHILEMPKLNPADNYFNLGGEDVLSVIQLTELIAERCGKILGFKPPIIRPKRTDNDRGNPLKYSIAKLKNTGFKLSGNIVDEIDKTLQFCKDTFK